VPVLVRKNNRKEFESDERRKLFMTEAILGRRQTMTYVPPIHSRIQILGRFWILIHVAAKKFVDILASPLANTTIVKDHCIDQIKTTILTTILLVLIFE
jgi:hypothetical protein